MMLEVERGQGEGEAGTAENDSRGRERWVRKVMSFCQDACLLAAAEEGTRQGGNVDELMDTENAITSEALAACVLLWGGLEAEATPTAVAIEYGRLRSALEGLSAREVVGVSGVLGFRVEGERAAGGGHWQLRWRRWQKGGWRWRRAAEGARRVD